MTTRYRFFFAVSIVGVLYCLVNVGYVASHLIGTPDGNILAVSLVWIVMHLVGTFIYASILWQERTDLLTAKQVQAAKEALVIQHLHEIGVLLTDKTHLQEEIQHLIELLTMEIPVARDRIPAAVRRLVLQRDNVTCTYCGQVGTFESDPAGLVWHLDHVVPVSRGGPTLPSNLTLACSSCNLRKGSKTPLEFLRYEQRQGNGP